MRRQYLVVVVGFVGSLVLSKPAAADLMSSGLNSCFNGYACGGTPVTGFQDETVCGTNQEYWTCNGGQWQATGQACLCANYGCPRGIRCDGSPVVGSPDQEVCGTDLENWRCTPAGWQAQHTSCSCSALPDGVSVPYTFINQAQTGAIVQADLFVQVDFKQKEMKDLKSWVAPGATLNGQTQLATGQSYYFVGYVFVNGAGSRVCTAPLVVQTPAGVFPAGKTVTVTYTPDPANYTGYSCTVELR